MPRKLSNWLDSYLECTDNSEPAYLYRKGCGLSVIASVLQRKCWIPFRGSILYPNLYIVLIGGTGVRKSWALAQAHRFITAPELRIKLAVDATSKVQLIKDFVGALEMVTLADGTQLFHSSMTIHSPELTVLIGYQNLDLLTALVDWYDSSKNPWIYRTGNAGNQEVIGIWANILGATTPDLFRATMPQISVGSGLIGRMLLLFSGGVQKKFFNDVPTKEESQLEKLLKADLIEISTMMGQFLFTPPFIDSATEFYAKFNPNEVCKDHRFEGYFNRKLATLYKLSMLFSACRDNTMSVTEEDFQRGIEFLEEVEGTMYWALQGMGRNVLADLTTRVMMEIGRAGKTTVGELMSRFRDDASKHEMEMVLQTLAAIKWCTYYTSSGRVEFTGELDNEHSKHDNRDERRA